MNESQKEFLRLWQELQNETDPKKRKELNERIRKLNEKIREDQGR